MPILSTIRSQVATKVLTVSGFKLSKQTPAYFGRTQDTIAHKGFTIGIDSTSAMNERQRRSVGVYCNSTLRVIFAHRLRPLDAYPVDYDNSLNTEEQVIMAVLQDYSAQPFQIRYETTSRAVTDSQEYVIITLEFTVLHTIN